MAFCDNDIADSEVVRCRLMSVLVLQSRKPLLSHHEPVWYSLIVVFASSFAATFASTRAVNLFLAFFQCPAKLLFLIVVLFTPHGGSPSPGGRIGAPTRIVGIPVFLPIVAGLTQ